jgi:hypothetical protein
MGHLLIGRPVLDDIGIVTVQYLDSVREKFHMHDFSHIGAELLGMGKHPSGALSKLLLKLANIPDLIEDLSDIIPLAKGEKATRRKKMKSSGNGEEQFGRQQSEDDDEDHDVLLPNIKFASLKEQSLVYNKIPDDDPIDYQDVEV